MMLMLPKQLISLSSDDALLKRWWSLGLWGIFGLCVFRGREDPLTALRWGDTWHPSHSPSFSPSHLVAPLSFWVKKSCLEYYPFFLSPFFTQRGQNPFAIPSRWVTTGWKWWLYTAFNRGQFWLSKDVQSMHKVKLVWVSCSYAAIVSALSLTISINRRALSSKSDLSQGGLMTPF